MSVAHDGYDFGGSLAHGDVEERPWDLPLVRGAWFGVLGEAHIIGEHQGRDLALEVDLVDYATHAAIDADIQEIVTKEGRLTGTLTITANGISRTLTDCTFLRFIHQPPSPSKPYQANAWCCSGILIWRQRKRS